MIRILITGADGQLGRSLLELNDPKDPIIWIPTDYPGLDITDETEVSRRVKAEKPDWIINCAAYTAVDLAEKETEAAFRINAKGPGILARVAREASAGFVHISTDYVFSGHGWKPWKESDPVGPLSAYGKSKLAGEQEVESAGHGFIIRTSWLYSSFGKNFLLTMLRLGKEKNSLGVVFDQIGSPTYASDLAAGILHLIRLRNSDRSNQYGMYHFCNTGAISWFDFASVIMRKAQLPCRINPIRTEEYPLPAVRPSYSVLDTAKFRTESGFDIPYWEDSLDICLNRLKA